MFPEDIPFAANIDCSWFGPLMNWLLQVHVGQKTKTASWKNPKMLRLTLKYWGRKINPRLAAATSSTFLLLWSSNEVVYTPTVSAVVYFNGYPDSIVSKHL